jgi:bacillithiol system protein YtxJ
MTNYIQITSTDALAEALCAGGQEPILFFKHSSTCGISARAFAEFEEYLELPESAGVRNYVIVVQTARDASDELARRTGVPHESPQAILFRDGRVLWERSHMAIKRDLLAEAARNL